jgi:hypothetical protein
MFGRMRRMLEKMRRCKKMSDIGSIQKVYNDTPFEASILDVSCSRLLIQPHAS